MVSSSGRSSGRVKPAEVSDLLSEKNPFDRVINFDLRKKDRPPVEERIVVFHLNGRDYTIPKRPNMIVGLKFARDRQSSGPDVAVLNLFEKMLGKEGFNALMEYDGLEPEDFETIAEILSLAAMGKLEAQK